LLHTGEKVSASAFLLSRSVCRLNSSSSGPTSAGTTFGEIAGETKTRSSISGADDVDTEDDDEDGDEPLTSSLTTSSSTLTSADDEETGQHHHSVPGKVYELLDDLSVRHCELCMDIPKNFMSSGNLGSLINIETGLNRYSGAQLNRFEVAYVLQKLIERNKLF